MFNQLIKLIKYKEPEVSIVYFLEGYIFVFDFFWRGGWGEGRRGGGAGDFI